MLRKLLLLLILAGLSFLAAWFADSPGSVSVVWLGYRIETTFFFLSIIVMLAVLLILGVYLLIYSLVTAPRKMREHRRSKHRTRGLEALTQAFIALGSDDTAKAKRMLQKADKMLETPAITLLLSAQLAKLQGDEPRTQLLLQKMLKRKETAFLAASNLLEQAKSQNSTEDAIKYARRMLELQPKNYKSVHALIDVLIKSHEWQEALHLTEKYKRKRIIKAEECSRILSVIYYNEGARIFEEGDRASAIRFLQKSHKSQPGFAPAATLLATMQHATGKKKEAIRTLRQCWKLAPHPDVIETLQSLYPEDDAEKLMKRVDKFTQSNSEDSESLFARAGIATVAKQWKAARNNLKILLSREETVRLCKLMAEVVKAETKDEVKASEWLLRASSADPDPAWVCKSCSNASEKWSSHCPACSGFDSLRWKARSLKFADSSNNSTR